MEEVKGHQAKRAFYDMSGEDNIYKYITTEGKIYGEEAKKYTMLEYLQKSTGVFNQDGMLTKEQVKEMKRRAQTGEKNLWHGFISFNKENSEKIDDPEKCIALIKQTFGQFFKDAGFNPDNIDLMCALHLDRPEHFHIHYTFWEKEPKVKNKRAAGYIYRKKGKIPLDVIDKMTERLNAYTIDDELAEKRQKVIDEFTRANDEYSRAHISDIIRKLLKELADELSKDKPLWYASKEIEPYRIKIDTVAEWLIGLDDKASKADNAFREELREKEQKLKGIMSNYYKERKEKELHIVQTMEGFTETGEGLKTLHTIDALEWDYKRRLGNIVLKKVREIQKETYKRNPHKKYKTNDKNLKRRLAISTRKVRGVMEGLFLSVAELFSPVTTNCHNRLKEIEQEIREENEKENRILEREKSIVDKWRGASK
ncbi:MAG: relaxase MobL [Clostridia bacterium]|nr:relaxase MobL [Clostridia bacterium]